MNLVVYTVVIGAYDVLRKARWSGVCLTDVPGELPKGWECHVIPKAVKDPRRASRHPKMLPEKYFTDLEYSIYLDGNLTLLVNPKTLIEKYLKDTDLAVFPHPQRKCAYHEASKCVHLGKVDAAVANKQMTTYKARGFPRNSGLSACWVLIRRHTEDIKQLGELWWKEYQKYSARDQLSFDYCRWVVGVDRALLPGNLLKNSSSLFRRGRHR